MTEYKMATAERRAALLQAGAKVAANITTMMDLPLLLQKAVDIICAEYGFYYAGIFLVDESGGWARLAAGYGPAGAAQVAEGHRLQVGGESMIGMAIAERKARIALDVGEEAVHFRNPHLPDTRSEMALPLFVADRVLGALTVQSTDEAAFTQEDILSLQSMADQLAIAILNAFTLDELKRTHAALLRARTYETLSIATLQAVHWIGNKAMPINTTATRLKADLAEGNLDQDSLQEDLELIAENTRLINVVKDTLVGPAIEQNLRPTLVPDVLQAAAFHSGIPAEMISIETAPSTPFAMTDSSQLARALSYLLRNAQEAGASHISANVTQTMDGHHVAIAIADDGPGIRPEVQEKMWTGFFTTKGARHTGIGLTAVLAILSRLDGRISVDSEAGKGAVFTVVLPGAPDDEAVDLSSAPEHIFFVDEEGDTWANFAANVLQLAGKDVIVQSNPAGAAAADLILVDEALTTMPVEEVLADLQTAGVQDKAVVVTAWLSTDRAVKYSRMGVRDVALKPYTYTGLANLLNFETQIAAADGE
jgi:signal transduction histidine kinase